LVSKTMHVVANPNFHSHVDEDKDISNWFVPLAREMGAAEESIYIIPGFVSVAPFRSRSTGSRSCSTVSCSSSNWSMVNSTGSRSCSIVSCTGSSNWSTVDSTGSRSCSIVSCAGGNNWSTVDSMAMDLFMVHPPSESSFDHITTSDISVVPNVTEHLECIAEDVIAQGPQVIKDDEEDNQLTIKLAGMEVAKIPALIGKEY